jgi:cell division protein FtsB
MPPSTIQKHRGIILIIGIALFVLFLLVYYAPYGCHTYLVMREDLARVNSEIGQLKAQNQEIKNEITLLKTDSKYLEQVARQKLGMLKKNEIIFEVPEKKDKKK